MEWISESKDIKGGISLSCNNERKEGDARLENQGFFSPKLESVSRARREKKNSCVLDVLFSSLLRGQ